MWVCGNYFDHYLHVAHFIILVVGPGLYHYTDNRGIDGISQSGRINPSTDTSRDARLGRGVYFTDKPPGTSRGEVLHNNYGPAGYGMQDRAQNYVRVEKNDLPGVRHENVGGRNIYVYPGTVELKQTDHKIVKRKY